MAAAHSPVIRPYTAADRRGVRAIYGMDEFARPRWLALHPCMGEYLADESSAYYTDIEPESLFVAEMEGQIVGALLGAVDTGRYEECYRRRIRPLLRRRCLSGAYGWPSWIVPIVRTEWAARQTVGVTVEQTRYPAHLHIGLLPAARRRGIGTALMQQYEDYLRQRRVGGYHLFAASFHPLGVAFYRKLGLEELGQFTWRFHDGFEWSVVTETVFGRYLG